MIMMAEVRQSPAMWEVIECLWREASFIIINYKKYLFIKIN